ncbi:hypothetical protein E2P81_ATG03025 [Venturia nashicola]|uniref:Uncharacterized protein n=1 Tax=Venturia nashicola TaxID=86259 RepID=A0A4Z1P3Q9_9PEZI|nr:hypothetical protein E6O75_ATG03089 [Venturia nashicola]TLD36136.1 hypothetical protein E2P81_ATG03025 [Venturia nashicola]
MSLTPMSGELLHGLAGIGAQFEPGQRQNATTTITVVASLVNGINTAIPCPYHSAILNMATNPPNNIATLQRMVVEHASMTRFARMQEMLIITLQQEAAAEYFDAMPSVWWLDGVTVRSQL